MFIDPSTKRNLYTLTVAVISLSLLPGIGPFLATFLNYKIAGTALTPGVLIGVAGLYVTYLIGKGKI